MVQMLSLLWSMYESPHNTLLVVLLPVFQLTVYYEHSIIFVHGLSGHPRRTWESCPPSKDDKTNKNTKTKHKAFHFPHFSLGRRRDRNTFGLADESNASSSGSYRVFWPGDLLLEDIPNARIFTYGYRADVVGTLYQPSNQNSIYEHTKDFIAKLSREVEEDTVRHKLPLSYILIKR
jgi:hypothetical protein